MKEEERTSSLAEPISKEDLERLGELEETLGPSSPRIESHLTTGEDARILLLQIVNGKEFPERDTPEQGKLRERLRRDVASINAQGGMVELPPEFS